MDILERAMICTIFIRRCDYICCIYIARMCISSFLNALAYSRDTLVSMKKKEKKINTSTL